MDKPTVNTVDQYIETMPSAARPLLARVRSAIRRAVPDADESISYGMTTYKLDGERVIYFAGWKRHVALYPATEGLMEAFKDELAPYFVEKATIRFPLSEPIPDELIERIARFRAKEAAEGGEGK
jgi:uncharacterized protein YdhG (YjbR/CyaY superfamily)